MSKKKPIIFNDSPQDTSVYEAQMMDLLVHYADSGVNEVEQAMRDEPDFFTNSEKMDLDASKVVLDKAPQIIEEYKRKVREFEILHDKIHNVVSKCEHIVRDFEERKAYGDDNVKVKMTPRLEPGMIRYTADGEMIIKKDKKVDITLPKSNK